MVGRRCATHARDLIASSIRLGVGLTRFSSHLSASSSVGIVAPLLRGAPLLVMERAVLAGHSVRLQRVRKKVSGTAGHSHGVTSRNASARRGGGRHTRESRGRVGAGKLLRTVRMSISGRYVLALPAAVAGYAVIAGYALPALRRLWLRRRDLAGAPATVNSAEEWAALGAARTMPRTRRRAILLLFVSARSFGALSGCAVMAPGFGFAPHHTSARSSSA